MRTIQNWDELLANVSPYLKSAQPLEAMKKAGFTFTGDIKKAIDSERAAKPIDPATAERLDKELASLLTDTSAGRHAGQATHFARTFA